MKNSLIIGMNRVNKIFEETSTLENVLFSAFKLNFNTAMFLNK